MAPPELVHNSAAGHDALGQQLATSETRLPQPKPHEVQGEIADSGGGPRAER